MIAVIIPFPQRGCAPRQPQGEVPPPEQLSVKEMAETLIFGLTTALDAIQSVSVRTLRDIMARANADPP